MIYGDLTMPRRRNLKIHLVQLMLIISSYIILETEYVILDALHSAALLSAQLTSDKTKAQMLQITSNTINNCVIFVQMNER